MNATFVSQKNETETSTPTNTALRFAPHYQRRIWGGRRLETLMHRLLPDDISGYGESWEICDRPGCQSRVIEGEHTGRTLAELWQNNRLEVFGAALARHPSPRYPLLMKILDAEDDLSVQVHPPANLAAMFGGEPKTEVWYVAAAEPGSRIYAGVRKGVDEDSFADAVDEGRCAELLHSVEVQTGQSMFVPSGRVHALGAGLVVFEVQQNSDTTFRIHDWGRTDAQGKPRELDIDVALECMNFHDAEPMPQPPVDNGVIAACPHFEVLCRSSKPGEIRQLGEAGEHLVVIMVRGRAEMAGLESCPGDFLMIPACLSAEERQVVNKGAYAVKWLEVRIPSPSEPMVL